MSFINTLRGLINDTATRIARIDTSTHTLQTIDYAHHEIHGGSHYFNEFTIDLPNNDMVDVRLTTSNTTKWIHLIISLQSQEEVEVTLYEDVSIINSGTPLTAFNSDRNSANTTTITDFSYIVNTNESNANADTDTSGATSIRGNYIIGSNQGNIEGKNRNDNEIILKQNTSYSLRLRNKISSTRYITWLFDWYEHTNKT